MGVRTSLLEGLMDFLPMTMRMMKKERKGLGPKESGPILI